MMTYSIQYDIEYTNLFSVPSCKVTEGTLDSNRFCVEEDGVVECYTRPGFNWVEPEQKLIGEKQISVTVLVHKKVIIGLNEHQR